jgi:hypothetical protein
LPVLPAVASPASTTEARTPRRIATARRRRPRPPDSPRNGVETERGCTAPAGQKLEFGDRAPRQTTQGQIRC